MSCKSDEWPPSLLSVKLIAQHNKIVVEIDKKKKVSPVFFFFFFFRFSTPQVKRLLSSRHRNIMLPVATPPNISKFQMSLYIMECEISHDHKTCFDKCNGTWYRISGFDEALDLDFALRTKACGRSIP